MVAQPFDKGISKPQQVEYDDPTIFYPKEDDEPLAETEYQYEPLTYAVAALKAHFADRQDVYVIGDMFVYYRMNDPSGVVAPDVFVVFGANGNHKRNSWFTWREGNLAPTFVMEIASDSTWRIDATRKRDIYAEMGVAEYWRFDPASECFTPPLIGERLVSGEYRPLPVNMDDDGMLRGHSDVLGLDICVFQNLDLRLYDPAKGEWLLNYQETQNALEEAHEANAELERRIQEMEEQLRGRRLNGHSSLNGAAQDGDPASDDTDDDSAPNSEPTDSTD